MNLLLNCPIKSVAFLIFIVFANNNAFCQTGVYYPKHVNILEGGVTTAESSITGLKIVIDEKAKKISCLNTLPKYADNIYKVVAAKNSSKDKNVRIYTCLYQLSNGGNGDMIISIDRFFKTIRFVGFVSPNDLGGIEGNYMQYQYR